MNGMTKQERLDDICRISGLSEDIVRRVQNAERESVLNSLKRGERASLAGRCVFRPSIRGRLQVGGKVASSISVKAEVAAALMNDLESLDSFEYSEEDEKDYEGIMFRQIPSLG